MANPSRLITQSDLEVTMAFVRNNAATALKKAKRDLGSKAEARSHLDFILRNVEELPRKQGIRAAKWGASKSKLFPDLQEQFRQMAKTLNQPVVAPAVQYGRLPPKKSRPSFLAVTAATMSVLALYTAGVSILKPYMAKKAEAGLAPHEARLVHALSLNDAAQCKKIYDHSRDPEHDFADNGGMAVAGGIWCATSNVNGTKFYEFTLGNTDGDGKFNIGIPVTIDPYNKVAAIAILQNGPDNDATYLTTFYLDKNGDIITALRNQPFTDTQHLTEGQFYLQPRQATPYRPVLEEIGQFTDKIRDAKP